MFTLSLPLPFCCMSFFIYLFYGIYYRADDLRIDRLGKNAAPCSDVVDQFSEGRPLHFLALQIGDRVEKVETQTTLAQFSDEQLFLLAGRNI